MSCAEALSLQRVSPQAAPAILKWLAERGGIQVWSSIDFSDPFWSTITPLMGPDGVKVGPPHWKADAAPRVITDPAEIVVSVDKEIRRFHVAIYLGSQGLKVKLKPGSTRRVHAAVAKAGEGAYHLFDFETQEAVIMAPASTIPLKDWADQPENAVTA